MEREAARERAREELRKCKEATYIPKPTASQDDKENVPSSSRYKETEKSVPQDESKRKATYESVKNNVDTDVAHKKVSLIHFPCLEYIFKL